MKIVGSPRLDTILSVFGCMLSPHHFDGPLLTTSVYWPLLFCAQVCLLCEVFSLWLDEWFVALTFRAMIGLVLLCVFFMGLYRSKERYATELQPLLRVIPLQDTLVMLMTQGLFVLYTWLFIYLPTMGVSLYYHQDKVRDLFYLIRERVIHYYNRGDTVTLV